MGGVSLQLLLVYVFIAGAGSTCVPIKCLKCNITEETTEAPCNFCSKNTTRCINTTSQEIPSNCKKVFQASVKCNGTKFNEGDDITLTCVHNLPTLPGEIRFLWTQDGIQIAGKNESKLFLAKVLTRDSGKYVCNVISVCGNLASPPHEVTVNGNSVVILVICGVAAVVLGVIMGVAMKYMIKRDNEKIKARMRQRVELERRNNPDPLTPRDPK